MLRIDKIRTFRLSCSIQIYVKRYYYLPEQTLCSELRRHFNSPDVRVSINRLMISFDTILPKLFSIQWHRMDWQLFVGARVRIEKKKYSCIIALLDTHFCKWLNPIDDNSFGGRFFFLPSSSCLSSLHFHNFRCKYTNLGVKIKSKLLSMGFVCVHHLFYRKKKNR